MPQFQTITRAHAGYAGTLLDLYDLDLSALGGPVIFLFPSVHSGFATVLWRGVTYQPFPIQSEGFETTSDAKRPRPKIRVSNIRSVVTGLLVNYGQLVGAQLTRHVLFYETTDNGPSPDFTEEFEPLLFYIEQKTSETPQVVEFALVEASESQARNLPRDTVESDYCPWMYRDASCAYVGPLMFDVYNQPISYTTDRGAWDPAASYAAGDRVYVMVAGVRIYYAATVGNTNVNPALAGGTWNQDRCAKTLKACQHRFGTRGNPINFGGFPATSRNPYLG